MEAVAVKKLRRRAVKQSAIPPALVYEVWNGKPIYYKGYRDVLAGRKTPQEIMSCSDLQAILVYILNGFLFTNLNRKQYIVGTNESGLHLAVNDNLGNDIAIFDKPSSTRRRLGSLKASTSMCRRAS